MSNRILGSHCTAVLVNEFSPLGHIPGTLQGKIDAGARDRHLSLKFQRIG